MRAIFFRDHEISGLGPDGADQLAVRVRPAGPGGAGEDGAAGHLVPRWGTGSVSSPEPALSGRQTTPRPYR